MDPAELLHRNCVEAEAGTRGSNRMRERPEHLMLPSEVLLLRGAVPHAVRDAVSRDASQRAVAEHPAENDLLLVFRDRILLDGNEDLVTLLDLARRSLALGREDRVPGGAA